ncbi:MAG TPA: bifunctional UDP-sugar hydrolase/5'-nucleotidase [Bacteroidales bacterium]|nr:bifunctional UDP-sugar hydrolase/5'-nucleotidase [Bacteroidales bacterium]
MKSISGFLSALTLSFLLFLSSCADRNNVKLTLIQTTDLHGVILPYDYIEKEPLRASLANSATYIRHIREAGESVVLLDNGDNLQGQPSVYYYNFIDTVSPHILSEAMNWLDFDATTVGNHDIEAGHNVYDRLSEEYDFPMLAANAVNKITGNPYFTPYVIIERDGIRMAILGLITPAVPSWLPEELFSGIEFRDMVETARLWMPEIIKQKPDLVAGLFHSGWNREDYEEVKGKGPVENGSAAVAYNVPGFDIIFCGHDHRIANEKFANALGDTILILNGGSRSEMLARADIQFAGNRLTGLKVKSVSGTLINVKDYEPDNEFIEKFRSYDEALREYVDMVIGTCTSTISSRDAYFGSSAFVDMIHKIQMKISGAGISFAAPLSFDVSIQKGPVTVGDMFKLYRFENMLYTMELTGLEIRNYLEYSYSEWLNTMKNESDYLLKLRLGKDGKPILVNGEVWLRNQSYNFDSAAGIDYVVDASAPDGQKVTIRGLSTGDGFYENRTYSVALNSYRGNGGGSHLTRGAGIKTEDLMSRVTASTDKDLRYYIMKEIESMGTIRPVKLNNWKIIPEEWVEKATQREYRLLFSSDR